MHKLKCSPRSWPSVRKLGGGSSSRDRDGGEKQQIHSSRYSERPNSNGTGKRVSLRRRSSRRTSTGSSGSMDSARSLAFADFGGFSGSFHNGHGSNGSGRGGGNGGDNNNGKGSTNNGTPQDAAWSGVAYSSRRKNSIEIKHDALQTLRQLQADEARFDRFSDDPNFPAEWGRSTRSAAEIASDSSARINSTVSSDSDQKKQQEQKQKIIDDASVHSSNSHLIYNPSSKAALTSGGTSTNLTTPNTPPAYWHRLATRSSTPDTPPNELVRRSAFMLMSSLTCGAGLVWALMYVALGESTAALFPTAYSVLMGMCFLCLTTEGRYHHVVFVQLLLILLLPICLQLCVGGIVRGGGVMIWSFLCPLGAALFCTSHTAKRWFAVYFLSMVGALLHELCSDCPFRNPAYMYHVKPVPLGNLEVGLFIMNICGAMTITFLGAIFFSMKLDEEFHRSEELLHNILPKTIAKRLKGGENHIVENFEAVTILFADLVGFTKASSELNANFLIGLVLRDVFSAWDALCEKRSMEKIKTIGDAYMCVGGLEATTESQSVLNGGRERRIVAHEMVILGLEMKQALDHINRKYGTTFQVRIGLHSGPCIAGVIGVKKFAYDVWGDAVNTASRMESHGIPGEIHISSDTYNKIKHLSYLEFQCCGEIHVKSKGLMVTYLARRREETKDESISNLAYESSPGSSRHVVALGLDSRDEEASERQLRNS